MPGKFLENWFLCQKNAENLSYTEAVNNRRLPNGIKGNKSIVSVVRFLVIASQPLRFSRERNFLRPVWVASACVRSLSSEKLLSRQAVAIGFWIEGLLMMTLVWDVLSMIQLEEVWLPSNLISFLWHLYKLDQYGLGGMSTITVQLCSILSFGLGSDSEEADREHSVCKKRVSCPVFKLNERKERYHI